MLTPLCEAGQNLSKDSELLIGIKQEIAGVTAVQEFLKSFPPPQYS